MIFFFFRNESTGEKFIVFFCIYEYFCLSGHKRVSLRKCIAEIKEENEILLVAA